VGAHFGIAGPAREHIPGARVHEVFLRDAARVYVVMARDDADEGRARAHAWRRRVRAGASWHRVAYEASRRRRGGDRVLDPLLVRALLPSGCGAPCA